MTVAIKYSTNAKILKGVTPQLDFGVSVTPTPLSSGVSNSSGTDQDVTTNVGSYAVSYSNFKINVTGGLPGIIPVLTSVTPGVCSVDQSGNVTWVSDGVGTIEVYCKNIGVRTVSGTLQRTTLANLITFSNYVVGSLGRNIRDNMLALISGKTPGVASQNLYSRNNYYTNSINPNVNGDGANQANNVIRNPSAITAGMDISGLSVGTWYAGIFPCALISPRHVIMATHVSSQTRAAFLGTDGTIYYADIISRVGLTLNGTDTDICVGYLGTAVPSAVTPFPVLPANYSSYFPTRTKYPNIPVLSKGWTSGDKWRIHEAYLTPYAQHVNALGNTSTSYYLRDFLNVPGATPSASPFYSWYGPIINGDSSGSSFLVITQNGVPTPVIMGCYSNPGGALAHCAFITEIESAMRSLAAAQGDNFAYVLRKADLSAFTTY